MGDVTLEEMLISLDSVVFHFEQTGINKLLVDATDLKSLPPIGDLYSFASHMANKLARIKQAVVVSATTPERMRFIDDVAFTKGATLKVYNSRQDALEWLG